MATMHDIQEERGRKTPTPKQKRLAYVMLADLLNRNCDEVRLFRNNGEIEAKQMNECGDSMAA